MQPVSEGSGGEDVERKKKKLKIFMEKPYSSVC